MLSAYFHRFFEFTLPICTGFPRDLGRFSQFPVGPTAEKENVELIPGGPGRSEPILGDKRCWAPRLAYRWEQGARAKQCSLRIPYNIDEQEDECGHFTPWITARLFGKMRLHDFGHAERPRYHEAHLGLDAGLLVGIDLSIRLLVAENEEEVESP